MSVKQQLEETTRLANVQKRLGLWNIQKLYVVLPEKHQIAQLDFSDLQNYIQNYAALQIQEGPYSTMSAWFIIM